MFGHERFEAYRLSIQFLQVALELLDQLPQGNAHLKDQLKRAATSVPLNIAEGSGKTEMAERLRYYSIARGSAMECAAICDAISMLHDRFSLKVNHGKALLESVVNILTTVCGKRARAKTEERS